MSQSIARGHSQCASSTSLFSTNYKVTLKKNNDQLLPTLIRLRKPSM